MVDNPNTWRNSVVLITSSDPKNETFGSGFVFYINDGAAYISTCTHIIREIGGEDRILSNNIHAVVVASDEEEGLDLTILKVPDNHLYELPLSNLGIRGKQFVIPGFGVFDSKIRNYVMRPIHGILGEQIDLRPKNKNLNVSAWDLIIKDEFSTLRKGYSGSPVILEENGYVIGVVNYRQEEGRKGNAISISGLGHIWPDINHNLPIIQSIEIENNEKDVEINCGRHEGGYPIEVDSTYNLNELHKFISNIFSPSEFFRFLRYQPKFQIITKDLQSNWGINQMADITIDYCVRHLIVSELIEEIKKINPAQYQRYVGVIFNDKRHK